ncbi:M23 family metallopeptidase, partial [Actinoplanes subglobosus]
MRLRTPVPSHRTVRAVTAAVVMAAGTVLAAAPAQAVTKAYYLPFPNGVSYRVTQGWEGSFSHTGSEYVRYAVDFAMPAGSTVVASAPGVVQDSYFSDSWGNTVVVQHPWGECTRYSHLSSRRVVAGQAIKQAQVLGAAGATGSATGAHLDFKAENCGSRYSIKMAFVEHGGSLYDSAIQGTTLTSRNRPPAVVRPVDTVGMFDPDENPSFHLLAQNAAVHSKWAFELGAAGDLPVTGDWDGNGKDSVGIFRPSGASFHLTNSLANTGQSDYIFTNGLG